MSLKINSSFDFYSNYNIGTEKVDKNTSEPIFNFSDTSSPVDFMECSEKPHIKISNNTANQNIASKVPDTGTTDSDVLNQAPNPSISIAGKAKKAVIVVDISTNILYKYDKEGKPEIAYRIASGKKSTPTGKGIRIVTHTEKFPYTNAYGTKRKRNPKAYGPYVICVKKIDAKTGEQSETGEFIHGTNEPETPKKGMYSSKGCMRMNNDVITKLKDEVQRGDIIVIK